jgi:gas vesicle protein
VNEILQWIAGGAFAFILILLGIEKGKTKKERKAKEKAEGERDTLQVIANVQQQADKIKDDLVLKQKGNKEDLKEVIQSIEEIPEEKEVPLSDEVKKAAADQSARLRAGRVQNDSR